MGSLCIFIMSESFSFFLPKFGISTPQQASAAADAGADGVIIGSRLVREAGESEDPAQACAVLVEQFAQALR